MIKLENIKYGYNKNNIILEDINLSIGKGEIVSILGANGCGKSTLLKIMLGVLKQISGSVKVYDYDVHKAPKKIISKLLSYVPQSHNAVFPYDVLDVVLMGRAHGKLLKNYSKTDYELAEEALNSLKIYHLKDRIYSKLSGGERQLVLTARAVAQGSEYCFMDEPVASLDYGNQYRLLDTIKDLSKKGLTFIVTTHNPDHVRYTGGRAVLMKNKGIFLDGRVEDVINKNSLYELYKIKVNDNGDVIGID